MIRRKFGDDKTKRQNKNYVALGASSTFFTFLLIVASPMLRLSFYVALSRIRSTDAPSIFLLYCRTWNDSTRRIVETMHITCPEFFSERSVSQRAAGRSYSSHALLFDLQWRMLQLGTHKLVALATFGSSKALWPHIVYSKKRYVYKNSYYCIGY